MQRDEDFVAWAAQKQVKRACGQQWQFQVDAISQKEVQSFSSMVEEGAGVSDRPLRGLSGDGAGFLSEPQVSQELKSHLLPCFVSGDGNNVYFFYKACFFQLKLKRSQAANFVSECAFCEGERKLLLIFHECFEPCINFETRDAGSGNYQLRFLLNACFAFGEFVRRHVALQNPESVIQIQVGMFFQEFVGMLKALCFFGVQAFPDAAFHFAIQLSFGDASRDAFFFGEGVDVGRCHGGAHAPSRRGRRRPR